MIEACTLRGRTAEDGEHGVGKKRPNSKFSPQALFNRLVLQPCRNLPVLQIGAAMFSWNAIGTVTRPHLESWEPHYKNDVP